MDQDNIGWKSWKLIAQKISPTPSLFVAQRQRRHAARDHDSHEPGNTLQLLSARTAVTSQLHIVTLPV